MSAKPFAAKQYWTVTTSALPQANGPIARLWVAVTGQLDLGSGDGSTFSLPSVAAGVWIEFKYPVQIVASTSTATGIVAEGWGAPGTAGALP